MRRDIAGLMAGGKDAYIDAKLQSFQKVVQKLQVF